MSSPAPADAPLHPIEVDRIMAVLEYAERAALDALAYPGCKNPQEARDMIETAQSAMSVVARISPRETDRVREYNARRRRSNMAAVKYALTREEP